jgi:hypothetical protein
VSAAEGRACPGCWGWAGVRVGMWWSVEGGGVNPKPPPNEQKYQRLPSELGNVQWPENCPVRGAQ